MLWLWGSGTDSTLNPHRHPRQKKKKHFESLLQKRREERDNLTWRYLNSCKEMKSIIFCCSAYQAIVHLVWVKIAVLFYSQYLKEFHNIHIITCQKTVAIRTVYSRARNTTDITVITTHHSGQLSQYDFLFPCAVLTAWSSAHTRSLTCKV